VALRIAELLVDEGCTSLPFLNSGVTEPKFTKFLHNVARSSQMNLLKSDVRYSTSFRNAMATNEGESADFAHFNRKISCQKRRKKKIQSVIYDQISNYNENLMKIGRVSPEVICLKC